MKLVKSLLLGSAAALVAGTAAQAADLPYKKAAPVEYVRVCDWTGAGYFYIPGTDTCLKIGGFARAEFEYQSGASFFTPSTSSTAAAAKAGTAGVFTSGRSVDQTGFFVRGRLEADARTQTAYGTIRTFVRYQIDRYNGAENEFGGFPGGNTQSAYIDKAFVQFAGILAGRYQSFFDFGADPYGFDGVATTDASTQGFAYTAMFAGGFSASVSIEDPDTRRDGINGTATPAGAVTTASYEGDRIPDVVGQLRFDQAWGAAQLSAAYHQVNTTSAGAPRSDQDGYAVRGGLQIKLPMLAAGDEIQIEGGYAKGAYSYTNSNGFQGGYGSPVENGGYRHANVDAIAIANGAGYTLALEESYSVNAGFQHYFTPTVQNIIFGSYEHVDYGRAGNIAWYAGGEGPGSSYRIADQINWFPVKDLQIGMEVMYINTTQKVPGSSAPVGAYAAVALPVGVKKDNDSFSGRLRIERDF